METKDNDERVEAVDPTTNVNPTAPSSEEMEEMANKSLEELTDYMSQYNLNFGTNIKDWNLIRLQLV